jgi:hypothetical protein
LGEKRRFGLQVSLQLLDNNPGSRHTAGRHGNAPCSREPHLPRSAPKPHVDWSLRRWVAAPALMRNSIHLFSVSRPSPWPGRHLKLLLEGRKLDDETLPAWHSHMPSHYRIISPAFARQTRSNPPISRDGGDAMRCDAILSSVNSVDGKLPSHRDIRKAMLVLGPRLLGGNSNEPSCS